MRLKIFIVIIFAILIILLSYMITTAFFSTSKPSKIAGEYYVRYIGVDDRELYNSSNGFAVGPPIFSIIYDEVNILVIQKEIVSNNSDDLSYGNCILHIIDIIENTERKGVERKYVEKILNHQLKYKFKEEYSKFCETEK